MKLSYRTKVIFSAVALIVLVVIIGFGAKCLTTAEVVDKGELLPYVKGYSIYQVRILDRFDFYVEPDFKPTSDAFNAYVLVGIAFISLTFATVIRVLSIESAHRAFWLFLCMFFGATYLATDELLGIHETLGHNMQFLTTWIPIAERPDDAIIMLYGVPALMFVGYFFKTLWVSKKSIGLFVGAIFLFAVGAVADGYALPIEEFCEVASSICLIAGVMSLGVHYTREWSAQNDTAEQSPAPG